PQEVHARAIDGDFRGRIPPGSAVGASPQEIAVRIVGADRGIAGIRVRMEGNRTGHVEPVGIRGDGLDAGADCPRPEDVAARVVFPDGYPIAYVHARGADRNAGGMGEGAGAEIDSPKKIVGEVRLHDAVRLEDVEPRVVSGQSGCPGTVEPNEVAPGIVLV